MNANGIRFSAVRYDLIKYFFFVWLTYIEVGVKSSDNQIVLIWSLIYGSHNIVIQYILWNSTVQDSLF